MSAAVLFGSTRRGGGRHPMQGALFSIQGLQADLGRHHADDVLLDVVRQILACRGTLLVELDTLSGTDGV